MARKTKRERGHGWFLAPDDIGAKKRQYKGGEVGRRSSEARTVIAALREKFGSLF